MILNKFSLKSDYDLKGDQPKAVKSLSLSLRNKNKFNVLLGVTGSGKTFTVANVIKQLNYPTLVISPNKTLAAQLYQEFRDYFPENAVSYFVSYYDYYQPEAYIPSTDTYIEKDADINELIDKLRLAATANIMSRNDVITVSSVSCIYNIGSPDEYENYKLDIYKDKLIERKSVAKKLVELQYERGSFSFSRGTFRVIGEFLDIYPAYEDFAIRVREDNGVVTEISKIEPISGKPIETNIDKITVFPAKHFMYSQDVLNKAYKQINEDLNFQIKLFKKQKKHIEAQRISQRVKYDLEIIKELGYVKGIENYSRYFDGRNPGDPPYSLIDYYNKIYKDRWLLVIDESHITFPQIRGMYHGDLSRKQTLIDYGFRLPSALDNRPLKFEEFMRIIPNFLAISATPSEWELSLSGNKPVQQLIRPTGIPDPLVEIKPINNQVADVMQEIILRSTKKQRTLVTTLTKKTAEELAQYLKDKGLKVAYLHSDIKTLERSNIIDSLRRGDYDCLIGINLLREGIDLPEVSLVAILDADKEGFLRSRVSLVQTMGRAARHIDGKVILYADNITGSIKSALDEVARRRKYQLSWNKKHNIIPIQISKPIREKLIQQEENFELLKSFGKKGITSVINNINPLDITPMDRKVLIKDLRKEMKIAASDLNFELAAVIRDKIKELE